MPLQFNPFTGTFDVTTKGDTGTVAAAGDGTAAAPGITFASNTNTGIYRPGADQLALSTNGNGRLFISSAGLVGVGTSLPAAIFSSKPSASSTTAATTFTGDGLFIDCANTTDGTGNYGGAISWSRSGSSTTRTAAITNVQTGSDSDVQGLAFLTHSSGTSTNPLIEAMRITGTGLVGIGVTDPGSYNSAAANLVIGSTTANTGLTIRSGATGVADRVGSIYFADGTTGNEAYRGYIDYTHSIDTLGIGTSGLTRLVIDSSGRLLVGTSSSIGGSTLQVAGTGGTSLEVSRFVTNSAGPFIGTFKSRGATVGVNTAVIQDDLLGAVQFHGAEGTGYQAAANIRAFVDTGTISSSSMPGRLVFSTTADGAPSPTPRLTITSTGQVRLAGAGITFNGDTATANELDDYEEGTWTPTIAGQTTTGTGTYSVQSGRYTKVGRSVYVAGTVAWSAHDGTGNMRIAGLPFTALNVTELANAVSFTYVSDITIPANSIPIGGVFPNSTFVTLYSMAVAGGTPNGLGMDGSGTIYFSLTYQTA